VASKIDYAATVWCSIRQDFIVAAGIGRPFEAIQRVASQAIVGVFRNTALVIGEAEAGIEPTVVRLRARILKHWIVCHTSKGSPLLVLSSGGCHAGWELPVAVQNTGEVRTAMLV
jgi:hypothetical protein